MTARLPAEDRRRQLLEVARHVFSERGFHGTSMNDVAEAAGVTKPVIYQHFPSKRALYLELLEDVGGRMLAEVLEATTGAGHPREQVERGFVAYFRFVDTEPESFNLLFGGGSRRDAEFADAVAHVEDTIAAAIAPLIEADIAEDHRLLLAYGIVGLAETTSRHWVAEGRSVDAVTMAARVAELAWAGLRGITPEPTLTRHDRVAGS